jgi:hypothetical protein
LKVIQQDIAILLMNDLQNKSFDYYTDPKNIYVIHRLKTDNHYNYYFTEKATQHIVKIEHSKKRIKKTIFTLTNYDSNIPGNIIIQHHDIKLKIELNLLKK